MPKAFYKYSGLGRRKTSVARVYMNEGKGEFTVNKKPMNEYFPTRLHQSAAKRPLQEVGMEENFTIKVRVLGGGITGQAEAIQLGIARALLEFNPELRGKLKTEGLLTRDSRETERKKYGQPGARKKFQYSKR